MPMHPPNELFHDLLAVIQTLRGQNGCPWDKQQTMETVQNYLNQEFSELTTALENKSAEEMREEMGDVLFLLIFMGEIAREEGYFTIEDVLEGAQRKLIRRHPHVFGDVDTDDISEIKKNWQEIKAQEKLLLSRQCLADRAPRHLSLLLQALWVLRAAGEEGWLTDENPVSVMGEIENNVIKTRDLIHKGPQPNLTHELGELLLNSVLLCRLLEVNPEKALQGSLSRLSERIAGNEPVSGKQDGSLEAALPHESDFHGRGTTREKK